MAGTVSDALVLNIDIAPTLIDLVGLPVPEGIDGISLAPLLRGERPSDWRTHFFFEHFTAPATVPRPLPRSIGVRTETDKYLIWSDAKPQVQEYYNLVDDPIERFNRFHVDTDRSHFLRDVFNEWDQAHPRNYDFMSYTHRPQAGAPQVDFERMRQVPVLRSHFERINAAREKRGVTWEQALNNPEIRWQIGVEAQYFY